MTYIVITVVYTCRPAAVITYRPRPIYPDALLAPIPVVLILYYPFRIFAVASQSIVCGMSGLLPENCTKGVTKPMLTLTIS